jgi:hypothetical protein
VGKQVDYFDLFEEVVYISIWYYNILQNCGIGYTSRFGTLKFKPETIRYHKGCPKGIVSIYMKFW